MSLADTQVLRPRVSVVIPNFNGIQHLPECLACLSSQSFDDFEVVMVDNASTDESVAWVRQRYPEVRIIQREVNGGPARSTNDGIRASRGEYVVLLDNDTAFDGDWLGILVKALDDHPEYDYGVSMILLYSDNNLLQSAGDVYSISRLRSDNRGSSQSAAAYSQMQRVVAASGNGAIHRREIFDDVGLYDEDYYAIHEDSDFSLRCLIKGKRCLYVPEARIRHKVGLCRESSQEAEMTFLRNAGMMAAKNLPIPLLALGILSIVWREFRSTVPLRPQCYRLFPQACRESSARTRARWKGLRMGWAKRRSVWNSRQNSRREIYRWLLRGEGPV